MSVVLGIVGLVVAGLLTSGSGGTIPIVHHKVVHTAEVGQPFDFQAAIAQAQADEDARLAAVAALDAQQAQELADRLAAAVQRSLAAVPATSSPSASGDFAAFRACTIEIESHGNYEDVDSTQTYWGAWQFAQGTWDGAVARAGYPEWSGQRPNGAPPAVQDAAAYQLWTERGNQPWGGRC